MPRGGGICRTLKASCGRGSRANFIRHDSFGATGVLVKEATHKGFSEAGDGDSISLDLPNSKARRGRVGLGISNTLTTSCNTGVVLQDSTMDYPKIIEVGKVKDGKHQQDLVQSADGLCRTICKGTHGSAPHLLKTLVKEAMRVKDIRYVEHLVPQGGSGTGYSEYDVLEVTFEDDSYRRIHLGTWYAPTRTVAEDFIKELGITTIDEGYMSWLLMELFTALSENDPSWWDKYCEEFLTSDADVTPPTECKDAVSPSRGIVDSRGVRYRVRKLTSRECFRLMGVSEEDITTMLDAGISKTQLYKLAGNSIVVDCLYYIFHKMFIDTSLDHKAGTLF